MSDDYKCSNCGNTLRSTGGAEYVYDDGSEKGKIVPTDVTAFTEFGVGDEREQLHYCPTPNDECGVVRVIP